MIVKDNNGQMSLEVLFLFAISIMILLAFTIPLSQLVIENNLDSVNSLNSKSNMLQLVNAIDNVYMQGMGAQQVVVLESNSEMPILIKSNSISAQIKLHDGKIKKFSQNHKADNVVSNLNLKKGVNKVLISWPEDSKNIFIDKI